MVDAIHVAMKIENISIVLPKSQFHYQSLLRSFVISKDSPMIRNPTCVGTRLCSHFSHAIASFLEFPGSELLNAVQLTAATALGFQRSAVNADTRLVWPSQGRSFETFVLEVQRLVDSVRCEGHRMMIGFCFCCVLFGSVCFISVRLFVWLVGRLVLYLQFGSFIFRHSHFYHPAIASISKFSADSKHLSYNLGRLKTPTKISNPQSHDVLAVATAVERTIKKRYCMYIYIVVNTIYINI